MFTLEQMTDGARKVNAQRELLPKFNIGVSCPALIPANAGIQTLP
jgi:hypothetical protein